MKQLFTPIVCILLLSCFTASGQTVINDIGTATCIGPSVRTLTSDVGGGAWSSTNTGVATIDAVTGVVDGIAAGTTTISYVGGATITAVLTVNSTTMGTISDPISTFCSSGAPQALTVAPYLGNFWSSSDPSVATVNSGGVVTPLTAGTTTITYDYNLSCTVLKTITVNQSPAFVPASPVLCALTTQTLTPFPTGGTWTSSNTGVATIGSTSGVLTGVAGGVSSIGYTVDGCSVSAFASVTNAPAPTTGTTLLCVGNTVTLSASEAGTWSSSDAGVASVVVGTGEVTGVSVGTAIISFTSDATGCVRPTTVTVNAALDPNTGGDIVCVGQTMTLSNSAGPALAWSSANTGIATVVTATGVVTGQAVGVVALTYFATAGCSSITSVTVNATPSAITGTASVCVGSTTDLDHADGGGTWSSSTPAAGTVDIATGVVTGIAAGATTITYRINTGCFASVAVPVIAPPSAITGTLSVCVGAANTLTSSPAGGTWSSSNTGIATVGTATSATTNVTGIAAGNANVSYHLSGCYATAEVTVNALPTVTSSGSTAICSGESAALTSGGATSYTWAPSTDLSATTGSSVTASPTSTITYTITGTDGNGCSNTTPLTVTVNPLPTAITGSDNVCTTLFTVLYSSSPTLGAWTSSNPGVATVNWAGGVAGISAGTSTISYQFYATGCLVTKDITVDVMPAATSGVAELCAGASSTFTNATGGGTWSSTNPAVASVGSSTGLVTGHSAGYSFISYVMPTGCYSRVYMSVVNNPSPISGTDLFCVGSNSTMSSTTPGGTWSSSNTAVGTIGSTTGIVTGLTAGTSTISYTNSGGCYVTKTITVSGALSASTGTASMCIGSSSTLSNATGGGVWLSSNAAIATVGLGTGLVNGISAGTANITYYIASSGCYTTTTVTVNAPPAAITGASSVCVGDATTLSSASGGGNWTSSNSSVASIDISTGEMTGVGFGGAFITYTLSTGCYATKYVRTNTIPSSITGVSSMCDGAFSIMYSATSGGRWTSSDPSVATIHYGSGGITGVNAGTTTITYQLLFTGCYTTTEVTVNAAPSTLTGASSVCVGSTETLSTSPGGGTWTCRATGAASIDGSTGVITGVTGGYTFITYTLPTGCQASAFMYVVNQPGIITGLSSVSVGANITLASGTPGGTWTSANPSTASVVGGTGVVTGVGAGATTITYTAGTGCYRTHAVTVTPAARPGGSDLVLEEASNTSMSFSVFPNPTSGNISVESGTDGVLTIYAIDGKKVSEYNINTGVNAVELPSEVAPGLYMCRFRGEDGSGAVVRLIRN